MTNPFREKKKNINVRFIKKVTNFKLVPLLFSLEAGDP